MTELSTSPQIGRTLADSNPSPHQVVRPPDSAPHVVMIVLDDLGFAQLGCYGSDLATPHIDGLADRGLRYNNFHATAACATTRACIITGRNHHAVGMGFLPEAPMGFPGYTARIPKSAGTLPRHLRDAGYNTIAVGKWHLTPRHEATPAGPFDRWPLGMGFERYYGFDASTPASGNQWAPNHLVRDNTIIEPPRSADEGYHLTEDLASKAIRLVQEQQEAAPGKPFFLYFSTFAVHEPHHVPEEWIDAYRGQFDAGWEAWRDAAFRQQQDSGLVPAGTVLTARPPWVADWDRLGANERRLYARMMETFAGYLTHTDAQIGRIIGFLRDLGILDQTLVIVVSDNGASAEGGPQGHVSRRGVDDVASMLDRMDDLGSPRALNHYPWGWAWAGNTPFKLWKRYSWLGGVRVPMIVHWPDRLGNAGGAVRSQFGHAVDLMPTILEAAGVDVPDILDGVTQQRIDGSSLLGTTDHADAPSPRDTQYFELMGSRSIYHAGWKATTNHVDSMMAAERELIEGSHEFDTDQWSLYDLDQDFSEANDLRDQHPDRLQTLTELWWIEAGRNQVLPLTDGWAERLAVMEPPPHPLQSEYTYRPGGGAVMTPWSYLNGFRLRAELDIPDGVQPDGVICAQGDWHGGWACYVLASRVVVTLAFGLGSSPVRIEAPEAIETGAHTVDVDYNPGSKGRGQLRVSVDGDEPATVAVVAELTLPLRYGLVGKLAVGRDEGLAVCDEYQAPFPFTGVIHQVTFNVGPPRLPDAEHVRAAMRND